MHPLRKRGERKRQEGVEWEKGGERKKRGRERGNVKENGTKKVFLKREWAKAALVDRDQRSRRASGARDVEEG